MGNAGLARTAGPKPAWTGFRPLRVTGKTRESNSVTSLQLVPVDGQSLAAGLPGRFAVVALAAGANLDELVEQIARHKPEVVSVADDEGFFRATVRTSSYKVEAGQQLDALISRVTSRLVPSV